MQVRVPETRHGELVRALQPDPRVPDWIASLNDAAFPCQSNEFARPDKCPTPVSVTFRCFYLEELNGGTRVILRLAGYLAERGHSVALSAWYGDADIETVRLPNLTVRVERDVRDAEAVVASYWPTALEVSRASLTAAKFAFLQGDEPAWPTLPEDKRQRARQAFSLPGFRYIAVCKTLAETCASKYGTPQLDWLPGNGVDSIEFAPRINSHQSRNGACFIHRNVWWKGADKALTAARRMQERHPQFKVYGAGFERFGSPGVEFLLNADSNTMADLYSQSDFYLSFSRFEGSPLPPLEAMACGCIPILTSVGVEDYLVDRENGFLVQPDDPYSAVAIMEEVLADNALRMRLQQNCLLTARSRPWSRTFEAFESLLLKGVGIG